MAVVRMNSIQSVEVDGVDVGSLASADKVLTFEQIQAAVVEWHDRERSAMQQMFSEELQRTAEECNVKGLELQRQAQEQIDALTTRLQQSEALRDALMKGIQGFASGLPDGQQQFIRVLIDQTPGATDKLKMIERTQIRAVIAAMQARDAELG